MRESTVIAIWLDEWGDPYSSRTSFVRDSEILGKAMSEMHVRLSDMTYPDHEDDRGAWLHWRTICTGVAEAYGIDTDGLRHHRDERRSHEDPRQAG